MDQLDLFGLMPEDEAKQYEKKKPVAVTASTIQHDKEKAASASGSKPVASTVSSAKTVGSSKVSDKSPEYLNYMKIFCWSAHYFLIKDRSLTLGQIRREMHKRFPELSKERAEMTYEPPKLPKKKAEEKQETAQSKPEDETTEGTTPEDEIATDPCECSDEAGIEQDDNSAESSGSVESEEDKESTQSSEEAEKEQPFVPPLEDPLISGMEDFEEIEPHMLQTVIKALGPHGLIMPVVKGGKKGATPSWVRTFSCWEDLLKRPAVCNHLQGQDGLYEVRISKVGIFTIRLNPEGNPDGEDVKEGVKLFVPAIPTDLLFAVRDFFCTLAEGANPVEALARIYWDGQRYFAHVPHQEVEKEEVNPTNHPDDMALETRFTKVFELHSHNVMDAFFSSDDNIDETYSTGIFGVWGNLDRVKEKTISFDCRIACGGRFCRISPLAIVSGNSFAPRHLPTDFELQEWQEKVIRVGG